MEAFLHTGTDKQMTPSHFLQNYTKALLREHYDCILKVNKLITTDESTFLLHFVKREAHV